MTPGSLLLETLREADAAQTSNLGQALAPAIAKGFQELWSKASEMLRALL
jgi:hypothetical protein